MITLAYTVTGNRTHSATDPNGRTLCGRIIATTTEWAQLPTCAACSALAARLTPNNSPAAHASIMRVYRVTLTGYNSRATHGPARFVYDVRATDPTSSVNALRGSLRAPRSVWVRDSQGRPVHPTYPEWYVVSVRIRAPRRVSQTVRPLVWLSRSAVTLVEYSAQDGARLTIADASGLRTV